MTPRPSYFPSAHGTSVLGHRGRHAHLPRSFVDRLNALQVYAAHRYVYMHPESGLEPFVERAAQRRLAGGRTT
ncbi:hypothetical protein [Streptomyces sp. NPDC096132]|uniref:hypothetical protein n=1 Tax=Streptomyces sp. NPDC096132 TaxID=3366075 RepID=UPI00382BDCF7